MPITTTDDFSVGKQFPPQRERIVRTEMERYYRLSQGDFARLHGGAPLQLRFNEPATRLPRLTDNLFLWLMTFWMDQVLEDKPLITGTMNEQPTIDYLAPSLLDAARTVVGDCVRYGAGCFNNREPGVVSSIDPRWWFPVRAPYDDTMGDTDIAAWPYARTDELQLDGLVVETYEAGVRTMRLHRLDGLTIGGETAEATEHPAAAFGSIVPVRSDSEAFYGTSDFRNAEQFVREIHNRSSQVSVALDRHASPHLALPESAMTLGEDGSLDLGAGAGMAIPMPDTARQSPSYVVWDAKFDSQESAIRRAFEAIIRGSRIAPILVQQEMRIPQLTSGAALRRLAVPTVGRIRDFRARLEVAMRTTIAGAVDLMIRSGMPAVMVDVNALWFEWPMPLSYGEEGATDMEMENEYDATDD